MKDKLICSECGKEFNFVSDEHICNWDDWEKYQNKINESADLKSFQHQQRSKANGKRY